ncbi:YfhO family protein, partial [Enterorhabdus sp. P55]|uniref:YfhO family protein n=1 Tax=Enterorhabdus sp. P55 TaxID=2304571 RepID=UPI001F276542
ANTRLATKPGDKLKIKMPKDKLLKNIVAIYKTSGHLTPKPELKNTFEITSGQTKTQVLKGTARKSGDLVIRVLYDKNIFVKVNGISVKPERAFSAFIRVPNVNKNDVIQVSYNNPIIKPMLIYTAIVILLSGVGYVVYYKISLERRRK